MKKRYIYVLKLWGFDYAFYSSLKKAKKSGLECEEITSEGLTEEFLEFDVERWEEEKDTQYARRYQFEFKRKIGSEDEWVEVK